MKIAHLTTVDMSLRYLLLAQLEAALDLGHEVVGISAPGPNVGFLEARGIRHTPLKGSTRSFDLAADARAARDLWRILRKERPDVLHTHNPKTGVYGRVIGRLAGVPHVVNTVHGLYATPGDSVRRRVAVYALEAIASRFSHLELVQNPEDLALLARLRITPRHKLVLLGNGVDLDRFRPNVWSDVERNEHRTEFGLRPDEVLIGTVGRLVTEKGYVELLAAASKLAPGVRLVVVGPDDPDKADALPPHAISEAKQAGVIFLGHRDDVERLYRLFDVFVLASHREGFPRAAMEAAASGLPIVATNIRGCRQVVTDGENGILVPVNNPCRLATAMQALANDRTMRGEMSAKSRAKAEAEFDEARVVQISLAAYELSRSGWERLRHRRSAADLATHIQRSAV